MQNFIKVEDVENEILRAMENPVDFNFAVDLDGRVYKGRKTAPHLVDKESLLRLEKVDKGLSNVF